MYRCCICYSANCTAVILSSYITESDLNVLYVHDMVAVLCMQVCIFDLLSSS